MIELTKYWPITAKRPREYITSGENLYIVFASAMTTDCEFTFATRVGQRVFSVNCLCFSSSVLLYLGPSMPALTPTWNILPRSAFGRYNSLVIAPRPSLPVTSVVCFIASVSTTALAVASHFGAEYSYITPIIRSLLNTALLCGSSIVSLNDELVLLWKPY